MATQLQLRRGTAAQNATFAGAQGELTMSTDTKALRIHDGSTTGGFKVWAGMLPDYSSGVTKAANQTHTATSDGWVLFYEHSNGDQYAVIDGIQLHFGAGNGGSEYSGASVMLPIAKGQTFSGADEITFFPCVDA